MEELAIAAVLGGRRLPVIVFTLMLVASWPAAASSDAAGPGPGSAQCEAREAPDLARVHGRIQVVESFPDYKIKVVENFADLHVQVVESFPDKPGTWKMVDSFPDYRIQFVESFPDFTIKYVSSFPGVQ